MKFLRVSVLPILVLQAQETCPDQRLKQQCEGICDEDFILCLESCSDNEWVIIMTVLETRLN